MPRVRQQTGGGGAMPVKHIIRHKRRYTVIENASLEDPNLSMRARGMLAYLLSKPEEWDVSIRQLARSSPQDSRVGIAKAIQELERYGYAHRQRERDAQGRLRGIVTTIYEHPDLLREELGLSVEDFAEYLAQLPDAGKPDAGKPDAGKPDAGDCAGSKYCKKAIPDLQQVLKEENPPIVPLGKGDPAADSKTAASPFFENWWNEYPAHRRIARQTCVKIWQAKDLDRRGAALVAHIRAMKHTEQWREGKIPNSTKYLTQERYETPPQAAPEDSYSFADALKILDAEGFHYD